MTNNAKPIVALLSGAFLLCGVLCQTTQAQSLIESGTATLADLNGTGPATGPDDLTVTYKVYESTSGPTVYTYDYIINNPSTDTGLAESFSVGFNAAASGALIGGTISGNGAVSPGNIGVIWSPTFVSAGSSSTTLSFQSDDSWVLGLANANGTTPGPWASTALSSSEVPVPQTAVPEPSTTALLVGCLLLLPFRSTILRRSWKE